MHSMHINFEFGIIASKDFKIYNFISTLKEEEAKGKRIIQWKIV